MQLNTNVCVVPQTCSFLICEMNCLDGQPSHRWDYFTDWIKGVQTRMYFVVRDACCLRCFSAIGVIYTIGLWLHICTHICVAEVHCSRIYISDQVYGIDAGESRYPWTDGTISILAWYDAAGKSNPVTTSPQSSGEHSAYSRPSDRWRLLLSPLGKRLNSIVFTWRMLYMTAEKLIPGFRIIVFLKSCEVLRLRESIW